MRVPVVEQQNWQLLRVAAEHRAFAARAADVARSLAFSAYDQVGAIRSVLAPRVCPKPSYRFCSQLVAEAYEKVGLPLFKNRTPGQVFPNTLPSSPYLHTIPLPLVQTQRLWNKPYPPELLDRSRAFRGSVMAEEGDIARAIFDDIAPLLKNARLPIPYTEMQFGVLNDVLSLLPLLHPDVGNPIADRLLEKMNSLKYFDLMVPLLNCFWFDVEPSPWWRAHAKLWREARDRHRLNAKRCSEANQKMSHALWMKLVAMYTRNAMAFESLIDKAGEK